MAFDYPNGTYTIATIPLLATLADCRLVWRA